MSSQQSKTFFKNFKETCRKIDNNINNIRKKLYEVPNDDSTDLAAKHVTEIQDKIKNMKTEAEILKYQLEPKLTHTAAFIQHFKELISETQVSVAKIENYLQQYGYKPLDLTESAAPPEQNNISPVKEAQEVEHLSTTPTLLDYGIVSHQHLVPVSQFKDRKSSLDDLAIRPKLQSQNPAKSNGNSGSTPTLEIDFVPQTEKKTPPMPEELPSVTVFPSTPTLEI